MEQQKDRPSGPRDQTPAGGSAAIAAGKSQPTADGAAGLEDAATTGAGDAHSPHKALAAAAVPWRVADDDEDEEEEGPRIRAKTSAAAQQTTPQSQPAATEIHRQTDPQSPPAATEIHRRPAALGWAAAEMAAAAAVLCWTTTRGQADPCQVRGSAGRAGVTGVASGKHGTDQRRAAQSDAESSPRDWDQSRPVMTRHTEDRSSRIHEVLHQRRRLGRAAAIATAAPSPAVANEAFAAAADENTLVAAQEGTPVPDPAIHGSRHRTAASAKAVAAEADVAHRGRPRLVAGAVAVAVAVAGAVAAGSGDADTDADMRIRGWIADAADAADAADDADDAAGAVGEKKK